ncbi:uncharacterized protein BP01DRAFT_378589 [Aspergillus saccharolyticus JOP 1030-1]|uniref:NAD(P)-binding protein n=1 Tax=Aspergillus saccharolyticus JOP 1030-1 TaxID=1450539 RepID=A0A318ZQS8_9EURO|nr:hypothetical protein BP01DRAFT_378589 [Aspergillus saccharolyticus JOP 1030-1]PYH49979.1 hypothetical protein BP01DRAFT_378589 [Aspergillus saccharolyticus JOP 1030-1]
MHQRYSGYRDIAVTVQLSPRRICSPRSTPNAASALLLFQTFRPLLQAAPAPKWVLISSNSTSPASMEAMSSFIIPVYRVSKIALNWLIQQVCLRTAENEQFG